MSYSVYIKRSAEKELDRLDDKSHERLLERILQLKENPRPEGSIKLGGQENYRIRNGEFRAVYSVDDANKIVEVIKIANRKDIYKRR